MDHEQFAGSHRAYDTIVVTDARVRMRDGVLLACDVYLPARSARPVDGRFPAIVERTPGLKDKTNYSRRGHWYASRGYAVVINDVRGRGHSGGSWYPFAHEAPDGYDVVEWVAQQSWCNGSVGTMGGSYSGSNQSALATLAPPHLRAQVIGQGTNNYFMSSMRQGGAMELRFIRYIYSMAQTSQEALTDRELKRVLDAEFDRLPDIYGPPLRFRLGRTALRLLPNYEQWAWDVLTHASYDEYWLQRGYAIDHYWDEYADVPVLFQSGWYDTYPLAVIANFLGLRTRKHSPMRLLIGPWLHTEPATESSASGDIDLGPDAALPLYDDMRLRFFDQHLKGFNTGLDREAPIHYFVMGGQLGRRPEDLARKLWHGGEWRGATDWPPPEYARAQLHLHADGSLRSAPPIGSASPSKYRYDPRDPVPTIGGSISAAEDVLPAGGFDQRGQPRRFLGHRDTLPLESRLDVLTFVTQPLTRDLEVVGPIEVVLYAASSARDTDFTAKLIDEYAHSDVTPGGYALNISDSIIRARFRNGFEREELLTPNEVAEFHITLFPTANRFVKGHRVRLDISSSNYPRFDANPNTGEALGDDRLSVIAHQSVFHDETHPSRVIFHAREIA